MRRQSFADASVISLVTLLILFALTILGTIWTVVELSNKVDTGCGNHGLEDPALVSSDTRETLRTRLGMMAMSRVLYNATSAMEAYENADMQTRRRLLQGGDQQQYLRELDPNDVVTGPSIVPQGEERHEEYFPFLQRRWRVGSCYHELQENIPACCS